MAGFSTKGAEREGQVMDMWSPRDFRRPNRRNTDVGLQYRRRGPKVMKKYFEFYIYRDENDFGGER